MEVLAAALLRAIYRSALPASEYTVLLQDLSLVEKCCAFLRGEFEYVNIIAILMKVATLTASSVFGPGDASKPLASLEGTLPFALDQSTAVFVCRAFDLFLLFITGKDRVFSDFFKAHGRFALSSLVNTANKHLFSTALGPPAFVRLSTLVRGVLQTLQQRSRRGFGDHSEFNIADLVGLDFFASSFLEDAKSNYKDNERFFADGALFRLINGADVSSAILTHASGAPPPSPRKAPKSRRRDERDQELPSVSGEDRSAIRGHAGLFTVTQISPNRFGCETGRERRPTRCILDAIKGEDGWRGLGSPGLNQGQQPALTSAPCEAELAPNPGHPPTDTSPERGGPRLPAHRQPPMESDHTSVWSPDSHHLPQARHESSHGAARHGVPQAHNGSDATAQVPGSLVRAAACEAA